MKKEIALFLVAQIHFSNVEASERGAGVVFHLRDGKTEYVRSFAEQESGNAALVTCLGKNKVVPRSQVEFFPQRAVCAKLTLESYRDLLIQTKNVLGGPSAEETKIFVTLPPEQDFENASAATQEVFAGSKISKGSDLSISVYRKVGSDLPGFTLKTSKKGKAVWTDSSGYVEVYPIADAPKK